MWAPCCLVDPRRSSKRRDDSCLRFTCASIFRWPGAGGKSVEFVPKWIAARPCVFAPNSPSQCRRLDILLQVQLLYR